MANLTSYVKWYRNIPFEVQGFSALDNLVFSELAYCNYQLVENEVAPLSRCLMDSSPVDKEFIQAIRTSLRFGSVLASHTLSELSQKNTVQFFAVQFTYQPGKHYIAFRGTDDNLVGWKEDLMIGYTTIRSQEHAVTYLEHVMEDNGRYLIGGHSKGGHLAVYASCYLSERKLALVDHVYDNDGPGLCPDVCDVSRLDRIRDRLTVIQPEFSVFGKIYEIPNPGEHIVVKAYGENLNQHSLRNWRVRDGELWTLEQNSDTSEWVSSLINSWYDNESEENRQVFTDELFKALAAAGATTRTQLLHSSKQDTQRILKAMADSDNAAKMTAARLPLSMIFGTFFKDLLNGRIRDAFRRPVIRGLALLLMGLVLVLVPERVFFGFYFTLLVLLVSVQFAHTIVQLHKSRWNFRRYRIQIYLCFLSLVLFLLTIIKEGALFIVASGASAFLLFTWGFRSAVRAKENTKRRWYRFKNIFEAVVTTLLAIFILLAPSNRLWIFSIILGGFFLIDGLLTFLIDRQLIQ